MNYNKPPISCEDHINLLIGRGLIVKDIYKAKSYIANIGYYRLTGYMYHLQTADGTHTFKKNVTFDDVLDHYRFDKALRNLLSDYLERIEVAIRAMLTDTFSVKYGFFWYNNVDLYADSRVYERINHEISNRFGTAQEQFVKAFKSKYTSEKHPPCNMALELLSFGKLSRLYEGLMNGPEKQEIARNLNLVSPLLSSWLTHLTNVRNVCAHHSRLWNRLFTANQPQIPSKKRFRFPADIPDNFRSTLYGVVSIMDRLLKKINPENQFIVKLTALIDKFPTINTRYMGFPEQWKKSPAWA